MSRRRPATSRHELNPTSLKPKPLNSITRLVSILWLRKLGACSPTAVFLIVLNVFSVELEGRSILQLFPTHTSPAWFISDLVRLFPTWSSLPVLTLMEIQFLGPRMHTTHTHARTHTHKHKHTNACKCMQIIRTHAPTQKAPNYSQIFKNLCKSDGMNISTAWRPLSKG